MALRTYNMRCLVLGKTKLGETDAIVTLLASDGSQVRAVAKGVRKPGSRFGARLEPYSEVDLLLHRGKSLDIVSEARTVAANASCRTELERSSACACVAELLSKATRDAASDERVFRLTESCFAAIGASRIESAALLACAHMVKAFAMMGVGPALKECALCGAPVDDDPYFDISAGGALCRSCSAMQVRTGSGPLVRWLALLLYSTFADISKIENAPVAELLGFCESWAIEHLSLKIRSIAFIRAFG